jgi:hypothetical protein
MTMARFAHAIAVAAVLLATGTADATIIFGVGGGSCETWTQARRQSSHSDVGVVQWALGFISAINAVGPISDRVDFLRDIDYDAIVSWMDNYCLEHPPDLIEGAVRHLALELAKRKSLKP